MYIPDPIERGENRAEQWADELEFDGDMIDCINCGARIDIADAVMMSPDPYCPLICEQCAAARGRLVGPQPSEGGGDGLS